MREKDIGDYFAPINTILIIINIAVFLFVDFTHSSGNWEWLLECGALYHPYVLEKGEYYRFLTSMFLHSGVQHIAGNMLMLWFIGGILEQTIGKLRYILIYFISGILAGITSVGYNMLIGNVPICVGASGAIFGVVGGLVYVVCVSRGKGVNLTPRQIILFAVLSLYSGVANETVGNAAHFGGFVSGLLLTAGLHSIGKLFGKPLLVEKNSNRRMEKEETF